MSVPDDAAVLRELQRVCGEHLGEMAGMDMVTAIEVALMQLADAKARRDDAIAHETSMTAVANAAQLRAAELEIEATRSRAEAAAHAKDALAWRARCPVTAADVTEAGITGAKAKAWFDDRSGWSRVATWRADVVGFEWDAGDASVVFGVRSYEHAADQTVRLVEAIRTAALVEERPAFEILDEMAACGGEVQTDG